MLRLTKPLDRLADSSLRFVRRWVEDWLPSFIHARVRFLFEIGNAPCMQRIVEIKGDVEFSLRLAGECFVRYARCFQPLFQAPATRWCEHEVVRKLLRECVLGRVERVLDIESHFYHV